MRLRVVLATLVLGIIALTSSVSAQTEVLFSETFAGPYQSSPNGWSEVNTPVGPYWYLRDGKYTTGNGDTLTTQDKRSYSVVDDSDAAEWNDYSVVVDAYMIQRNGGILLVGRWGSDGSHYEASYETIEGVVSVAISRVVGRRTEVLAQVDSNRDPLLPDLANGATPADGRQFRLTFDGDRIALFIDRREVLEVQDVALAHGAAGVGQFENFVFFDNFRVLGADRQPVTVAQPTTPTPQAVTTIVERVFRLVVAEGWSRQQARDYQRALEAMEFSPVVVRENPRGGYDVLTGTFLSQQEAERQGDFLLTEGDLIDYRVVEITQGAAQELQAASEAVSAFTVEVAVLDRQGAAEATMTHLIEDLDYFPVTLFPRDNQYAILVGNFSEREEAQLLISGLRNEGFNTARVTETPRQELVEATPVAASSMVDEALSQMSDDERSRVEDVLEAQRILALGGNTADQIQQLQSVLQELRQSYSGLRESVLTIQEQARAEESLRRDVSQKIQDAESAIDQRNWGRADLIITEILSMDPNNANARLLMARVRAASSSGAEESSSNEDRVQRVLEEAHRLEVEGNLRAAIDRLTVNATLIPGNELLRAEIDRLEAQKRRQDDIAREESLQSLQEEIRRDNRKQMLVIGIAVVAIVIVIVLAAIWFITRDKKSQPKVTSLRARKAAQVDVEPVEDAIEEDLAPEPEADAPPAPIPSITPTGSGGIGLDPAEADQDVSALSAAVVGTIGAAKQKEAEPEPEVRPEPLKLDAGSSGPAADSGRLDLGFGGDEPEPEAAPEPETPTPAAPDSSLIDIGFGDDPETPEIETPDPFGGGEPTPAPVEEPPVDLGISDDPITTPATLDLEATQPLAMDEIDTALGLGVGAAAGAAAAGAGSESAPEEASGTILEQTFTSALAGQQPPEWTGSYDFASLTVDGDKAMPGGEASLCYRKQTGAGSALYTCRFPEVSGVVHVEFDLCCETKNQYLLGIYFENQGNFRQSVHTVIHRSDDSVTLRLQGKAAPYEFDQWVHIKYRIDLGSGTVDGSVDGQPVAVRVPLVTMPEQEAPTSIDTISIRDTLATEGVFFLDNIRIVKD